jgi:type I restriction enzyme S subunit
LINLLEEQKQAVIHRAVTRGLDPNVRLKASGVGWLGDIPEHWEVLPVRYIYRVATRRDIRGDEVKLSVTQKHGLVPTDEMVENSMQASSYDRFQVCHPGDLVLNKYKAHLGVFWGAERRGLITPNYTVFRPAIAVSTKYYELLFHTSSYRNAFSTIVYGVTEGMSPLYTQDFYRIAVLLPPLSEQDEIVRVLAGQTATEDRSVNRIKSEVALLREYRTRLVADVVTGKLDVRAAAASLPDEVDETELADETEAGDEGPDEGDLEEASPAE